MTEVKKRNVSVIKQERHKEAFLYYLNLGENRSYGKVARVFGVSGPAVRKWSINNNWQGKLHKQLKQQARLFQLAIDKNQKIRVKSIGQVIESIGGALKRIIKDDEKGEPYIDITISSPKDLHNVVASYGELIRLEQLLAGQATSRPEHTMPIADIFRKIAGLSQEPEKKELPEPSDESLDVDFSVIAENESAGDDPNSETEETEGE